MSAVLSIRRAYRGKTYRGSDGAWVTGCTCCPWPHSTTLVHLAGAQTPAPRSRKLTRLGTLLCVVFGPQVQR